MNIVVHDPYGNRVVIPEQLLPDTLKRTDQQEVVDSPDRVIAQPAMMLTTCADPAAACTGPCTNHYFRLIGPDDTLLISARKEGEDWVAFRCLHNPSTNQLGGLFQNARPL